MVEAVVIFSGNDFCEMLTSLVEAVVMFSGSSTFGLSKASSVTKN
jgi:hypothetical protein